jgi:hypothetical protein
VSCDFLWALVLAVAFGWIGFWVGPAFLSIVLMFAMLFGNILFACRHVRFKETLDELLLRFDSLPGNIRLGLI